MRAQGSAITAATTRSRVWPLVAAAAVLGLVPLGVLATWSIHLTTTAVRRQADQRVAGTAAASAAAIQQEMQGRASVVQSYATRPTFIKAMGSGDRSHIDSAQVRFQLNSLQRDELQDGLAFVATPKGTLVDIVPDTPSIVGKDFSYRDWYRGATSTGKVYVSRAYETQAAGGGLVVGVAALIRPESKPNAPTVGILVAASRLDSIQKFVDAFAKAQGVSLSVTDQAGALVARPGTPIVALTRPSNDPAVATALAGGSVTTASRSAGAKVLSATVPVAGIGWTVTATLPESVALAEIGNVRRGVEWITALLAAVLIGGLALVARSLRQKEQARLAVNEARLEADRANNAKSEFLSRMSHELRTPLNAILGFAQVLELDGDPAAKDGLGHIIKGGRHLLDLINEILDLSRIESGRLALSVEAVNVVDVVAEVVDLIRPIANADHVTLSVESPPLEGLHVRADRQRLKQVLVNLVANAVKYTPAHGHISVAYRSVEGAVRIIVADTGPGIPPDRRTQLFEPFERLGAEYSNVEGTGLGLSLSSSLVQLMGGTIGLDDNPDHGSAFWVELAEVEPIAQGATDPTQEPADDHVRHGPCTVLYVEDNPVNIKLVERMLEHRPDTTLHVATLGGEAVDLAAGYSADIVLLDLHLPDMSGEEVLQRLSQDPRTSHTPVVIVSADATPSQVQRLSDSGAAAYVTKPFDIDHLLRTIDRQATAHDVSAGAPAVQTASPNSEHLDPAFIANLRTALGDDGLADLIETFVAESSRQGQQLRELHPVVHREEVRRLAHSLKGSASMLGAERLVELLEELEAAQLQQVGDTDLNGAIEAELALVLHMLSHDGDDPSRQPLFRG